MDNSNTISIPSNSDNEEGELIDSDNDDGIFIYMDAYQPPNENFSSRERETLSSGFVHDVSSDVDGVLFNQVVGQDYVTQLRINDASEEKPVPVRCDQQVNVRYNCESTDEDFNEEWIMARVTKRYEYMYFCDISQESLVTPMLPSSPRLPLQVLRAIPALPMCAWELSHRFPLLYTVRPIRLSKVEDENIRLERKCTESTHSHVPRWTSCTLPYNTGKMYIEHLPGSYNVSLRAISQGTAIWHRMILSTASCAISNRISHGDGVLFLLDAAIRISANCVYLGHGNGVGIGDGCWVTNQIAGLPSGLTPCYLARNSLWGPDQGPSIAIMRGFLGALAYWPELRVALAEPATASIRYATGNIEVAEWFLFSRTHCLKPSFVQTERELFSSFFSLYVTLCGGILNWICRATAMYLGPPEHPELLNKAMLCCTPYYHIPLNSDLLCDLEVLLWGNMPLKTICETHPSVARLMSGYHAIRTASTNLMLEFADRSTDDDDEGALSAYLGLTVLLQRALGHTNLLLMLLAGATLYGGKDITVLDGILSAYVKLITATSPLYSHQTLTSFWKDRDDAMRTLHIEPCSSVAPIEHNHITQAAPCEVNFNFVGADTIYPRDRPVRTTSLAQALMEFRDEIVGIDCTHAFSCR
ncbi:unknown [Cercopithecine alphaherpesvirus 9]|uniref:Tegument protein UL47 n=1 Tax=Cercopithecine herpesvirus 9 (strain DHV) TaxID=36348 RepID=Q9E204_CHV9D|nr:tegument protein VP13/14 [Cercopithecine alphaherpesvirus 9]AAG27184.1 unknown [Cercopithecine alphaherpesvirus 9]